LEKVVENIAEILSNIVQRKFKVKPLKVWRTKSSKEINCLMQINPS
jgi:hypothetical protein